MSGQSIKIKKFYVFNDIFTNNIYTIYIKFIQLASIHPSYVFYLINFFFEQYTGQFNYRKLQVVMIHQNISEIKILRFY